MAAGAGRPVRAGSTAEGAADQQRAGKDRLRTQQPPTGSPAGYAGPLGSRTATPHCRLQPVHGRRPRALDGAVRARRGGGPAADLVGHLLTVVPSAVWIRTARRGSSCRCGLELRSQNLRQEPDAVSSARRDPCGGPPGRVGGAHCCAPPPSGPCMPLIAAHGPSKPRGRLRWLVVARCLRSPPGCVCRCGCRWRVRGVFGHRAACWVRCGGPGGPP